SSSRFTRRRARTFPSAAVWLNVPMSPTEHLEPAYADRSLPRHRVRRLRSGELKLVEVPRPRRADGRALVRITAAGVTPLDHTLLSGRYPRATAPLILGNEGAGVVEDPADSSFPVGSRVMFAGPYGVSEDGAYSEWIAVRE